MRPFQYVRPNSFDDLFDHLEKFGTHARLLAGGTDVLIRMHLGHMRPQLVIDIKNIAALRPNIVRIGDVLRVTALTTMTDVFESPQISALFPGLAEAARVVGSVQIRNRATLVGNICNASPAADTASALLVYHAAVNLISRGIRRTVPLTDFFTGPGKTVRAPNEIVESIDLPLHPEPAGSAFGRVTRRRGVDLATINLTCFVNRSGEARFGYGAVGPRPFLVRDTTGVLASPNSSPSARRSVLRELTSFATPITDIRGGREYRQQMLAVMSGRALETALDRLSKAGEAA